ncbi:MAG: T9SS type A sorting domain-containing protein, partial [Polaribacter sp.]|nr:T9SS type A sorting domain-containing protein [Polaribacter sp.]
IYPNPTNGNTLFFNLTKDARINIYNILGKLVKTAEVKASNNTLDIATLNKGIYFLKINSGVHFTTKKLLIN